ncbi:MAG: hypothetical protein R3F33_12515 [Planctomycetota bacterium]
MGIRWRGGTQFVVCLALTALALFPVAPLEAALDRFLVSSRALLAVAKPLWGMGRVHAADDELQSLWRHEAEESVSLEKWVRDQAAPQSVPLPGGITVHGEAVGRVAGKADRLMVRVEQTGLVRAGMPVTTGDHYLGLVREVWPRRGPEGPFEDVTVELITSSQARVQAVVFAQEDWQRDSTFVVGGLLDPEDFQLTEGREVLAVHHPSSHAVERGRVFVNESRGGARDLAWLVNGFQVGELTRAPEPDERTRFDLFGVVPGVDFESGLFQVLIHTGLPPEAQLEPVDEQGQRGRWLAVRRVPMIDAAPWREGFPLLAGSHDGLQNGAAIVSGVRLLGRVRRVTPYSADVVRPGDVGFSVPALALWLTTDAGEPTFVLGRLRSLGRDASGRLRLLWPAILPAPSDTPQRARLYTGSGDPGVPRGLCLGEAEIPPGPGPHILWVEPLPDEVVTSDLYAFQFEGDGQ